MSPLWSILDLDALGVRKKTACKIHTNPRGHKTSQNHWQLVMQTVNHSLRWLFSSWAIAKSRVICNCHRRCRSPIVANSLLNYIVCLLSLSANLPWKSHILDDPVENLPTRCWLLNVKIKNDSVVIQILMCWGRDWWSSSRMQRSLHQIGKG